MTDESRHLVVLSQVSKADDTQKNYNNAANKGNESPLYGLVNYCRQETIDGVLSLMCTLCIINDGNCSNQLSRNCFYAA